MSRSHPQRKGFFSTLRLILCRLLCGDEPPPPPPPAKQRLSSFEPGQVAILAEYPPNLELTPREIVARVAARLDQVRIDQREKVILAPDRVIILRGAQRTLATVMGDVPEARQDARRLIRFIDQLHTAIKKPPLEGRPPGQGPKGNSSEQSYETGQQPAGEGTGDLGAAQAQPGSPGALASAARPLALDADDFDLRAASPNWYASGAKDFIGGGPGAWPVSAQPAISAAGPQPYEFNLPAGLEAPATNALPVEVAILDTAPRMVELRCAYDKWVGNDPAQPPQQAFNPLLKSLLAGPNGGPFNVVDQSDTPDSVGADDQLDVIYTCDLAPVVLAENPFPMDSHGLFIAGIIRSIAPQAKLRLIQVLNSDGGGSLDSVAKGLACANYAGRTTPLVINCSFAMHIPLAGEPLPPDLPGVSGTTIVDLTQLLSDIFAHTNQTPTLAIVAAAGNTGTGGAPPAARYPAAFNDVAGVAALKQDDDNPATPPELTDYSDVADNPPEDGFAVFGGEKNGIAPAITDAAKGMLGVFIERLPIPDIPPTNAILVQNTTGWARWAGTSFAAPIVSAVLANKISGGNSPLDVVDQLIVEAPDIGVSNAISVQQPA